MSDRKPTVSPHPATCARAPAARGRAGRNWPGPWPKTPGRIFGTSLVRLYQLTLSGFVGNSCRHLPTCSEYAHEAIARHGLWAGGWMGLFRVSALRSGRHPRDRPGARTARAALSLVSAMALLGDRTRERLTRQHARFTAATREAIEKRAGARQRVVQELLGTAQPKPVVGS